MTRTFSTLGFLALSATAAHADGGGNIYGGTTVPAGKWPDAVAVLSQQGSCTGTLIAPDVVLTAGHCIGSASDVIIANTTDYNQGGGEEIQVANAVAYPNWEATYDIGVLTLAEPSSVTPRQVGTACTFTQSFPTGASVKLVGFGATQTNENNSRLMEVTTTVGDPDCSNGDGCNPGVSPGGEFVAGGGGIDTCYGDSGGPVYLTTSYGTMVVGVVSRGVNSSPDCGGGGIYVRTDKVVSWIEQTTGRTIAKTNCNGAPDPDPDPDPDPGEEPGGDDDGEDPDDGGGPQEISGGCSAVGGSGADSLWLVGILGAVVAWSRRRR